MRSPLFPSLALRRLDFSLYAAAICSAVALLGCDASDSSLPDGAESGGSGSGGSGSGGSGGSGMVLPTMLGQGQHSGSGSSTDRYHKTPVQRNGVNYFFMANGWGPGFQSQTVSWNGTQFSVDSMAGTQGAGYEPASYPTMFCGVYSDSQSGACGLPKAIAEITSLRTGWRWTPNTNNGEYNAAYDIWLGNGTTVGTHSAFLMIWLREPNGQQPAGATRHRGVVVANAPGMWNVWAGTVGGKPYVAYVRAEGQDSLELEVDVMDFVRDVPTRGLSIPGSHVLSVAVGFEIWEGPITALQTQDFYVTVQ